MTGATTTVAPSATSPADLSAQIEALRRMSLAQLRDRYREVFGEDAKTKHRDCLWRQIAWRVQADSEGGLSERAKRLAADLARDSDVRARIPRDAFPNPGSGEAAPPAPVSPAPPPARAPAPAPKPLVPNGRDPRLPAPGTVLVREYRGTEVRVAVREDGFEYSGRAYETLSAVAREVTGSRWNGFLFFGLATRTGKKGNAA